MPKQKSTNQHVMRQGKKLFITGLDGQLQRIFHELRVVEQEASLAACNELYRRFHTVKGSAAMLGFPRLGKIAETLVSKWEWTQDVSSETSMSEDVAAALRLQAAIEATHGLMRQLATEYDASRVELDMDEQQEHSTCFAPALSGSRLLVIDDDDVLRSYLVERLRTDGYDVTGAPDVDVAKLLLREHTFDLVTLDLVMYPKSGYELFQFLKADPTLQWLPLIVISGREEVADKVRSFYLGADDYVTKPVQYEELAARIYGLLKRTKSFEQLAFRDPLTGVYNRLYFDNLIKAELQRVERYPAPLTIVFLDIDRFKSINDTYGHHIGDLVLQGLSHIVQKRLRATDLLARFGGEEFVIAMPNTTPRQAVAVIESILAHVRTQPAAQYEGQAYWITFSAGAAEWSAGLEVHSWLRKADFAMYQAKQQGRNCILIAGEEAEAQFTSHTEIKTDVPRKSVLVVDDDDILRSIVVGNLQDMPIDIIEAKDGEEGYRLLASRPFDLCILDGVMPGLDGFALLERLHEEAGVYDWDRTKVLLLSGRKKDEEIARGYQLGAHDYIPKPFSLVEFSMRVKRLLDL